MEYVLTCLIKWNDNLGNERSPLQYFLHLHPDHLEETLPATNLKLAAKNIREITVQEYFVYVGLKFAMSFYPKFRVSDMFSRSAPIRRSQFLAVPDLSQFMSISRYMTITNNLTFTSLTGIRESEAFWEVQPLIDAFNLNRQKTISPGWQLCADESILF